MFNLAKTLQARYALKLHNQRSVTNIWIDQRCLLEEDWFQIRNQTVGFNQWSEHSPLEIEERGGCLSNRALAWQQLIESIRKPIKSRSNIEIVILYCYDQIKDRELETSHILDSGWAEECDSCGCVFAFQATSWCLKRMCKKNKDTIGTTSTKTFRRGCSNNPILNIKTPFNTSKNVKLNLIKKHCQT